MGDFTLYFLGYDQGQGLNEDEKKANRFNREAVLELTHNHGTESDPSFQGYSSGNCCTIQSQRALQQLDTRSTIWSSYTDR